MSKKSIYKLKCKICGHEDGNLVPHIESEHPEISLSDYMAEHGGLDSVIHPALQEEAEKEEVKVDGKKITIAGVEFEKPETKAEHKQYIPKADPYYMLQNFTSDVCHDIQEKKNVFLTGHTGTGKTSLLFQIAALIGQPVIRVNLKQQTTVSDFVGCWTVKAGETVFSYGVLPRAMKEGFWVILDEVDYAEPSILCALNSVLDRDNPSLTLTEKDYEVIMPHKNFRIFATANAAGQMSEYRHLYQGTNLMNEAFLRRWNVYKVDYLPATQEETVISKHCARMPAELIGRLVRVANMARKGFTEETLHCTFSTQTLIDWAQMIVRHKNLKAEAPIHAASMTLFNKISREDAGTIEGMIRRVMGRNE
jgi:cobaltochelatase CobS